EFQTLAHHVVQHRRRVIRPAVAAEVAIAQIVSQNEEDIRALGNVAALRFQHCRGRCRKRGVHELPSVHHSLLGLPYWGTLKLPSAGGTTGCSLGFSSCGIQSYGTR